MKTTIKENVKKLLVRYTQTRDNETDLCYLYYINFCGLGKSTSLLARRWPSLVLRYVRYVPSQPSVALRTPGG